MLAFKSLAKSKLCVAVFSIFLIGALTFGTYKAFDPKPAYAQCVCGAVCTSVGGGISSVMGIITNATMVVEIYNVYTTVTTLFNNLMSGFNTVISGSLVQSQNNTQDWYEMWHAYDFRPALQDQIGQLNTMEIDQTRQMASFEDAKQDELTRLQQNKKLAEKSVEAKSSDQICPVATVATGITRSRMIKKKMSGALIRANIGAGGNASGTRGEDGDLSYQFLRLEEYKNLFCDQLSFNGFWSFLSCPYQGRDVLVEETMFKEDTIDVDSSAEPVEVIWGALADNLIEPNVPEPTSPYGLDDPDVKEVYLYKRAVSAQKTLAKKAVFDVLASRSPGSRMGPYVSQIRQSAGVDLAEISDNPSYHEVVNAITKERFETGLFNLGNIDNPEAVERNSVALQAVEIMRMNDNLDMLNHISMMLASQVAKEIVLTGGLDSSSGDPGGVK